MIKSVIRTVRSASCVLTIGLVVSACSPVQRSEDLAASATGDPNPDAKPVAAGPAIALPPKTFVEMDDGSIQLTGHWVLQTSEPPKHPNDFPFAAQALNSTIIHCSAATRTCAEYRAQIVQAKVFGDGMLFPLEPMTFSVVSWDRERVVASWTAYPHVECLLRIDRTSKEVEMEYRRQPSSGRSRVFERWVLE